MQGTTYARGTGASAVVLSGGFQDAWRGSLVSLSAVAVANDSDGKMRRGYWHEARRHLSEMPAAEQVGLEAARRTLRMLGARKIPTCEAPIVFPQETARSILGLLASCVMGSAVWRKSSYLIGREGSRIASPLVTVVDDPLMPRGFGSRPHDGEGLGSRRNVVVDQGVLKTLLCDSYSARKLGRQTTASASRGSAAGVGPSTSNFVLQPIPGRSEQDIVRQTDRGLYVVEMMGFGFNPTTGDFSRGASGLWIEAGALTYPVTEVTISLNLDALLQRIDAVADGFDLRSSTLSPALRVESMTIAGT
jgi:PmbA protein